MSTIVSVKNTNAPGGRSVHVISERIVEDGRERHPNGVDEVPPNTEQDFILHAGQSIRVVEVQPQTNPTDEA